MKPVLLALVTALALATQASVARAQQQEEATALHVVVDAPGAPGTSVTLRFVAGPDSLRGRTRVVTVPAAFMLPGDAMTLVAERSKGHGAVRLRVERPGTDLKGEGTADRVWIEVNGNAVQVRTLPWWLGFALTNAGRRGVLWIAVVAVFVIIGVRLVRRTPPAGAAAA
jgi:hypothetical protein